MIDFYWLKSFTEIMQLFLSVLFIIYLRIKFDRKMPVILWLSLFFYIKLATDLYGILNYTSWISTILTRPALDIYRMAMGAFELGMIMSLFLCFKSFDGLSIRKRTNIIIFIPSLLIFPINLILVHYFQSSLLEMFNLVKAIWLIILIYLLVLIEKKPLQIFLVSLILWNIIWLTEVVLHQQFNLISEGTSWVMFVLAELILTVGLSYFLIQIIAYPKILRIENVENVMPHSLLNDIESKLKVAFEVDRLYKNSDLSAVHLAEKLDISAADLATYLNRVLNKNFNQHLIDYRIEESKRLFKNPETSAMTIEQIMVQSGFNSKSVFNTAFKKRTGLTPSQYRKIDKQ